MPLKAVTVKAGRAFHVQALEEDGKCPFLDFLNNLDENNSAQIQRYIERTAEIGLITSPAHSKAYGKKTGIFYWRAKNGARVFYFTDVGKVIICAHGYIKKKNKIEPGEADKALILKAKYKIAKNSGTLEVEENSNE